MCVVSPVVKGVVSESVCMLVYVVCVLVCGFGALGALRIRGKSNTHSDSWLSSLSGLSAGILLAFCLLDIIPNVLSEMRDTFTGLNITLCFPVPEFMVAVGFLLLLVMEQLILALQDERNSQKERRDSPMGLSVEPVCLRFDLLLRSSLLVCCLVVLLSQSHMRRSAVSVCLMLLSLALPLGLVLRHSHCSVPLARCTLEGLSAGSCVYIVFMDVIPRVTNSHLQPITKITLILTGFSVFTAALLLKL